MSKTLIKNARIVRSLDILEGDLLIDGERIAKVGGSISETGKVTEIDAEGALLFPGMIDDQVHFREPGLTHKADIFTESGAAVAGGITSFMEMPNTNPPAITQELLEEKYAVAAKNSPANYSFFMGVSNDNLEEVKKTDPTQVCGLKIFMGSSTGNMLVDNEKTLENVFSSTDMLIATHCEDELTITENAAKYYERYGDEMPMHFHPNVRSEEACYLSSSKAVAMAKKYGTQLHILHISTAKELELFKADDIREKHITAEACVHHLWFTDMDYFKKGSHIKWNPAVKTMYDRDAIRQAVINDKIDVIATDHAPHTLQEKDGKYWEVPSGGPLVQHALPALLELVKERVFTYPLIARKTAKAVAERFKIVDRGRLDEGYFADVVLVKDADYAVTKDNILYKCGWSPFEGTTFSHTIAKTWVNGSLEYDNGKVLRNTTGKRLTFNR